MIEVALAIAVFLIATAGMAIGLLLRGRAPAGSCEGVRRIEGLGGKCELCGSTPTDHAPCSLDRPDRPRCAESGEDRH